MRPSNVARVPGSPLALLSRWQRTALAQAEPGTPERREIKRLCAEPRGVETRRDPLRKAVTIKMIELHYRSLSREQVHVIHIIRTQAGIWTVVDLCRVLDVSRSGYYP